jgi:DNA-binding HxlR family transcriptional regulator
MPVQKGYRDACGMAVALDLVGERWALLVVRELLLGPKRFTDLHRALTGASPNALSERLRELVEAGVLRRHRLLPPAASWVYELTDWGHELQPILFALGTWALRSGQSPDGPHLSPDSAVLGTKAYYRHPDGAPARSVNVRLEGEPAAEFGIRLASDGAEVSRSSVVSADASLVTDPRTYVDLHGHPERLSGVLGAGAAHVRGDATAVLQMFERTIMPAPAPADARP